jgi:hypothetical protein
MGTFHDSKIVTARKVYKCDCIGAHIIAVGQRYLRYKLGQRNDRRICMACAVKRDLGTGPLAFDCAAVRELCPPSTTASLK